MPEIQITDQLDKPIETVPVDLAHPSSLVKYLQTQLLHLAVVPDFLARKDSILSQAATKPIQFQARASNKFELGNTRPEILIKPAAQAIIRVNASPGTNLFADDPFHALAQVPEQTGYVSAGFDGALDLGVSGSEGDLTFGFNTAGGVHLEYWKAFPLGGGEPTLQNALAQTMSSFVIPADLSDLNSLGIHDVATISGHGSITVAGAVTVAASPNPLASVDLPLGVGSIGLKAGVATGFSASFTVSGAYQVRARRKDADTVELSFLQARGTGWQAGFSATAGISSPLGERDLVATLLGAISTDPTADKTLLGDLSPAEISTLAAAIKNGLNHGLQASLDAVRSAFSSDQAASSEA